MPISASKARSLCTESEYNLFKWSNAKSAKTLAPSQLKQKLDRARKLRDKYRDLAKQQRGEARGKRKPTGTRAAKGNERTVEKAQLFAEVLDRFEQAMKSAGATTTKRAAKSTKKSTKRTTGNAPTQSKAKSPKTASAEKAKTPARAAADSTASSRPKRKKSVNKATPTAIPLATGATVTSPSLGKSGHASPFSDLVGTQGKSDIAARGTRRKMSSKAAQAGRIESQFARTVQEKIHGHVSSQSRRDQARRDVKQ